MNKLIRIVTERIRVINKNDLLRVIEIAIDNEQTLTEYANLDYEHHILSEENILWLRTALINRGYSVEKIDEYLSQIS